MPRDDYNAKNPDPDTILLSSNQSGPEVAKNEKPSAV